VAAVAVNIATTTTSTNCSGGSSRCDSDVTLVPHQLLLMVVPTWMTAKWHRNWGQESKKQRPLSAVRGRILPSRKGE
jgi:hypothetical protein